MKFILRQLKRKKLCQLNILISTQDYNLNQDLCTNNGVPNMSKKVNINKEFFFLNLHLVIILSSKCLVHVPQTIVVTVYSLMHFYLFSYFQKSKTMHKIPIETLRMMIWRIWLSILNTILIRLLEITAHSQHLQHCHNTKWG